MDEMNCASDRPQQALLFDAPLSQMKQRVHDLEQSGARVILLKTSRGAEKNSTKAKEQGSLILYQDLPVAKLLPQLESLINLFVAPRILRGEPVYFISPLPRHAYQHAISSDHLHDDLDGTWHSLLMEQLFTLLDKSLSGSSNRPTPSSAPLDADLDASQMRAVASGSGPVRVLAPAGSGKTKTLTNRIIHLIGGGVPPERVLALAFNKKAADEMASRLSARGIPVAARLSHPGVVVRTFHGLGYEFIRREFGWQFRRESEEEILRRMMETAVSRHHRLERKRNQDPLDPFLAALKPCKLDLVPLDDVTVETEEQEIPFRPLFEDLLQLQMKEKFCTFDDMIYLAVRLLLDRSRLRREMQDRFDFVLVDEFQDLNRAQLLMMQMLALPKNNLFVVGDDDQMIYGWRGADIRHILEFTERYAGAHDVTLTTNYRSTRAIVRHSRWLIEHNRQRVAKDIGAAPGAPDGGIEIYLSPSLWKQAQQVADWIQRAGQSRQNRWDDLAVLFRYHAYKYLVAILLDAAGVPHTPVDGRSLAQTAVGRDLYAYLNIILHPDTAPGEAVRRTLKRPNKYITSHFILGINSWEQLERAVLDADLEEWMRLHIEQFLDDIRYLRRRSASSPKPGKWLGELATIFRLREFYQEQIRRYAPLDEAGLDVVLDVLISVAQSYPSLQDFFTYLDEAINSSPATVNPPPASAVTLSTIHASKGREFHQVALFNLSQTFRAGEDGEEEERRVAYVGLTRASEGVFITGPELNPSRFLIELALDPDFRLIPTAELKRRAAALHKEIERLDRRSEILKGKMERDKTGSQPKLEKSRRELHWIAEEMLPSFNAQIEGLETEIRFRQQLREW